MEKETINQKIKRLDEVEVQKLVSKSGIEIIKGIELTAIPMNNPKKKGEIFHCFPWLSSYKYERKY